MKHSARRFNLILLLATSVGSLIACSGPPAAPPATPGSAVAPTPAAAVTTAATQPAADASRSSPSAASAAASSAPTGPATKAGWWIRINPTLTTAQQITFQVGTDKLDREEWRVWKKGEPTDMDVPANYQQAPRLYLRGNVTPIGQMADLCLMYRDRGVEHMDFDDDESETKSRFQMDPRCR
ncbi:MAG: hypothetical protein ABI882_17160 [Acidobacteriota bacterium]